MASMWMPGAKILRASSDGGSMLGGPKKVVWHTTENDPKRTSALNVARYLRRSGNDVHIVWNPVTGEIVQTIPANRAGKGLKNAPGGAQTNRGGTYVIQIEVVGQAAHPFTTGPCKNLDKILAWLKSLGVPATFPGGAPRRYGSSYVRSRAAWTKSGHFGHSQVPENSHGDPGAVSVSILTRYPGSAPKPPPHVPQVGDATKTRLRTAVHLPAGYVWDDELDLRLRILRTHSIATVADRKNLQIVVGATSDGIWGGDSHDAFVKTVNLVAAALGAKQDGKWNSDLEAKFQAAREKYHK